MTEEKKKRAEAMIRTLNDVRKIMEDRDKHNDLRDFLLRTDPKFIFATIQEGKTIPRYILDLITVLTKLYDEGYDNASSELDKFK